MPIIMHLHFKSRFLHQQPLPLIPTPQQGNENINEENTYWGSGVSIIIYRTS